VREVSIAGASPHNTLVATVMPTAKSSARPSRTGSANGDMVMRPVHRMVGA
jgi:hypothetical protein